MQNIQFTVFLMLLDFENSGLSLSGNCPFPGSAYYHLCLSIFELFYAVVILSLRLLPAKTSIRYVVNRPENDRKLSRIKGSHPSSFRFDAKSSNL